MLHSRSIRDYFNIGRTESLSAGPNKFMVCLGPNNKDNSVMTELTQFGFGSPLFGSNVQFAIFTLYPLQM
jgi:hypothetical protein